MEPEGPEKPNTEAATAEAVDDSLLPIFMRSEDAKRNVKNAVWKELGPSSVKPHRSMPTTSLVTRGTGAKRNPASHTKHFEQAPPQPPPQYLAEHATGDLLDAVSDDALDPPRQAADTPASAAAVSTPVVPVLMAPVALPPPLDVMPPAPQFPPPGAIEFAERSAAAVSALRLTSERLAEQARSDALELALLVSRRILEAELSTNVERFFGVIRSVIRRAGESRRIVVRLAPEDAKRVESAGGGRALSAMSVAQVEVSPDADLELGDCMVDADFGMVDGRLTTRLDEMRRLLQEAMAGEDP